MMTAVAEAAPQDLLPLALLSDVLQHGCFTNSYGANVEIMKIPHPYSEDAFLECIHYPPHRTTTPPPFDKPILFIHGAFHGAWCFGILQQYFQSRGVDTYAVSLRNHGGSFQSSYAAYTHLGHLQYDVEVAVRHLFGVQVEIEGEIQRKVKPYILVGHSVGGAVVQRFVSTNSHPRGWSDHILPAALVLLFSFAPVSPQVTWIQNWWARHPYAMISAFLRVRPKCVFEGLDLVRDGFFTERTPEEVVVACHEKLEENESLAFMIDLTFQPVFSGGARGALKLGTDHKSPLKDRIIVMGAGDDKIITKEIWEGTAAVYGTEAVVVKSVGHNGFLDLEWKTVAVRLEEALSKALTSSQPRRE